MHKKMQNETQELENSYLLSFMQQGMLVHSLLYPGSGVDIEQLVLDLHERLDPLQFRQVWSQTMARHAVLRTSLRWLNLKEPIQEVFAKVSLPWAEEDWTGTAPGQRRARLLRFLDLDRRRGFDLSRAPLWRLTLIRLGGDDWQLVWTFHHAILEGRSYALLLREIFQVHDALRAGNLLHLAEARPYRDYIDWLSRQDFHQSASFWRNVLKGFQAPTPIAIDQISKVTGEQKHDRIPEELSLSPNETSALRAMAEESKITMNTIIQGVWAIILSIYSSEGDVVFGVIRAGRPDTLSGSEEMVGLFLNSLPMRVQVDPSALLTPWLKKIRTQWSALRAHEHTPLARIQAWSSLQGRSPLFETTVMYERYQLDVMLEEQTGGAVQRSALYLQTNNKLDFAAYDGTTLRLRLDFDHTRIERQLARRLLLRTGTLLQAIAQSPHQTIGALKLVDSGERAELLTRWNETAAPSQMLSSLDEMVRRRISEIPDAVAIAHGDVRLTYGELGRRASLLAGDLREQGLSAGSFAAVLLNRSIESAVSALAVLMTGAAYIPIDPGCPINRLNAILHDAKPLMLIAHSDLARSLPPKGAPMVIILDGYDWTRSGGLENPPSVGGERAAYLIYTSGSTGLPKGVVVPHRAIVNHIQWMQQTFPLNVGDRVLQQTSFGFDVAVWEFFGTLCTGATLVIPTDIYFDMRRTLDTIAREKITVLQVVPSLLRALLNAPALVKCRSLRHVFCGGEPMPDDLPRRFYAMLPTSLHNMYGPTETTIDALYFSVPRDWTLGKVPIGSPILNTQAHVLDANLEPVPLGVPGELYIGGAQVAHGYHNQPALTKERFISDPFSAVAGAKLYKTGDIVRRRLDGKIEFLSRRDDQFKIRGVRGELGDVESALLQFPYVDDCVVVLEGRDDCDKQLLAYVVMTGGGTVERLRRFLRSKVAIQHVPTIVTVGAIPRSANGKVDRAQLPLPPRIAADGRSQATAFNSPMEASLARIWCELLQRDHVEAEDNFFDLGGDSLLAVTLVYCIEDTMGVQLGMPEIFSSPVFCQMAQLLATRSSAIRPSVTTIQEGSPAERSIYFIYAGSHEFDLARMLGVKRNVYGVEVGWPSAWRAALERGDTSRYPSMEQLVEPFCSTIFAHAGSRPLVVAGYSFAGLMAFETARQLKVRGALVDAVLLFDTVARRPSLLRVAWNDMLNPRRGKMELVSAALTRAARAFYKTSPRLTGATSPQAGAEGLAVNDRKAYELSLSWLLMEKLYESVEKQYRPRKLDCRGIVVVANSEEATRVRRSAGRNLGWKEFFAIDLQVITAANDHLALPRGYDRELELKLVAALDRLH
jgi:amino acid adenylation domain-containing protein